MERINKRILVALRAPYKRIKRLLTESQALLIAGALLMGCTAFADGLQFKWTTEASQALPYSAEAMQGETFDLVAKLVQYGAPMAEAGTATFYYNTKAMGAEEWYTAEASWDAETATASVTWSPAMDVGATAYRFFFGITTTAGKNYRVYGTLRLKASPGFTPAVLGEPETFAGLFDVLDSRYMAKSETLSVTSGAAANQSNIQGVVCSFDQLGFEDSVPIVPKTIAWHSRTNKSSDNTNRTNIGLQIRRYGTSGWYVAYESTNAINLAANDGTNAPLPAWTMAAKSDTETAIPPTEKVCFAAVDYDEKATPAATDFWTMGFRVMASKNYAWNITNSSLPSSPSVITASSTCFIPVMYITADRSLWGRVIGLEEDIATNTANITDLTVALGLTYTQAQVDALLAQKANKDDTANVDLTGVLRVERSSPYTEDEVTITSTGTVTEHEKWGNVYGTGTITITQTNGETIGRVNAEAYAEAPNVPQCDYTVEIDGSTATVTITSEQLYNLKVYSDVEIPEYDLTETDCYITDDLGRVELSKLRASTLEKLKGNLGEDWSDYPATTPVDLNGQILSFGSGSGTAIKGTMGELALYAGAQPAVTLVATDEVGDTVTGAITVTSHTVSDDIVTIEATAEGVEPSAIHLQWTSTISDPQWLTIEATVSENDDGSLTMTVARENLYSAGFYRLVADSVTTTILVTITGDLTVTGDLTFTATDGTTTTLQAALAKATTPALETAVWPDGDALTVAWGSNPLLIDCYGKDIDVATVSFPIADWPDGATRRLIIRTGGSIDTYGNYNNWLVPFAQTGDDLLTVNILGYEILTFGEEIVADAMRIGTTLHLYPLWRSNDDRTLETTEETEEETEE